MRLRAFLKEVGGLRAALFAACFLIQAAASNRLEKWVHPRPFEASSVRNSDKRVASTLRAAAFLSGFKVLVGHLFWIKVIQYYGDDANASTQWAKLYDYCSIASDLNPGFISIYTYGASALAFHLRRVDQAARLLEKGIAADPRADRLKLLLAAIGYQNSKQYNLFIPVLQEEAGRPDAPTMLVNILANTYEKVGRYKDAVRLWRKILRQADTDEQRIVAAQKLQALYKILRRQKEGNPAE